MPTVMPFDDKEKPRERKLSTASMDSSASGPRLRTRSFKGRLEREYVGDEMDQKLELLHLVKKAMPKDNTSIFRAVCEQISSVQTDHEDLRILVEQILRPIAQRHFNQSEDISTSKYDRDKEIFEILADITSSRIKVYRLATDEPDIYEPAEIEDNREILVCDTPSRGVYDSVYSEDTHEALAYSQSIIYHSLYEKVYNFDKAKVQDMVDYIRSDNDKHKYLTLDQMFMSENHHMHGTSSLCTQRHPQFPFCVCKSLDPAIYRNVEFALYKMKTDEAMQAAENSRAVKFGVRAICQARDGSHIRKAVVLEVVKPDVRRVAFENGVVREFDVSDLRPLPQTTFAHHSMQTLMNETGRGGRGGGGGGQQPPMQFLPGCMPQYPYPPPPYPPSFSMPPSMHMGWEGGPAPSPPPFMFSPPMMYGQQFFPPNEMMTAPQQQQQPPLPMDRKGSSIGYSPAPGDSSLDASSVFPATPLSSRKGEDGRRREAKPRALSVELLDSPISRSEFSHNTSDLTWWNKKLQGKKEEGDKRRGGRRATEGDTVGEMNRPLQPKQQIRLSTCGSVPESELPSLVEASTQQMQHLQLQGAADAADAASAARAKLPSLLPLPQAQARPSYYASSEWTGSDTVFKDGEESISQLNVSNNRDAPLLSSSSVGAPPPFAAPEIPYFQPVPTDSVSVPHITPAQLSEVETDVDYSKELDGSDLPPNMLTTRFFYNMGLMYYRKYNLISSEPVQAPPADDVPMPPQFFVNSPQIMPPNSSAFFPLNMPNQTFHPSAAPPNTPMPLSAAGGPLLSLPPHLMQYCNPGVEGMPTFGGYPNGGYMGGQFMDQGSIPSPMTDGSGQFFFPPNK